MPFLDIPLIADYHHAYNLSDKLSTILMPPNSAAERDPRLDLLKTSLVTLSSRVEKNAGVLRIVLRSNQKSRSGKIAIKSRPVLPSVVSMSSNINTNTKKDESASLESKTAQILAILPHLSQSYVTHLLRDDTFRGNIELILEGLFDGSLGSEWEDVKEDRQTEEGGSKKRAELIVEETRDAFGGGVAQRRNVFDDEELDITRIRVSKQERCLARLPSSDTF
jgi:activating signal cointegrator complex subunit 2